MSDWTGEDLEMVSNPVKTVREAVREYAGDGEGIDDAILDGFILKVRADALRAFADEWGDGNEGFPYGPLYERVAELEGEA